MVLEVKLQKVGEGVGIVLPEEALAHMKVAEGGTVCLTEAPDRSLRLTPSSEELKRTLEAADRIMFRYRNTLRKLAE